MNLDLGSCDVTLAARNILTFSRTNSPLISIMGHIQTWESSCCLGSGRPLQQVYLTLMDIPSLCQQIGRLLLETSKFPTMRIQTLSWDMTLWMAPSGSSRPV